MDSGYVTALVGLAGAIIGGLTSFGTTWLTQTTQMRERALATAREQREQLYVEFVKEASRLFGDALTHEKTEIQELVNLYSITAHIRMVSPPDIVESADRVIQAIVETYVRPNLTMIEMREFARSGGLDPLQEFAFLCRNELSSYRSITQAAGAIK
jgi:hypothetical protein